MNNKTNKTNKKNSYRGKRHGKKEYGKDSSVREVKTSAGSDWEEHSGNDIEWYTRNPSLFEAATSVNFALIEGDVGNQVLEPCNESPSGNDIFGVGDNHHAGPAVMRIKYVPGIGKSISYNDAANRAFQAMMSNMFSRMSGTTLPFPQYMLALWTIAGQSIAQNIAMVKRALRCSYKWEAWNKNYPIMLIKALGFNPDTIMGKQQNIMFEINDIIRDFNALCIPNFMPSFKRHYALCKHVYQDQDSVKAQNYVFTPQISYVWSDLGTLDSNTNEYDGIACCVPVRNPVDTDDCNIMDLCAHIRMQLEALRSSSDFWAILGNIKRAYADSSFLHLDEVLPEVLEMKVDRDIAYQINNAVFVGHIDSEFHPRQISAADETRYSVYTAGYISGDPVSNIVTYYPTLKLPEWTAGNAAVPLRACGATLDGTNQTYVLNTFENEITRNDIMEFTRLMSYWEPNDAGSKLTPVALGTEFLTEFIIYVPTFVNGEWTNTALPGASVIALANDFENPDNVMQLGIIPAASRFHKAPRFAVAFGTQHNAWKLTTLVGDLNLWTTISRDVLERLHTCALLSIYDTAAVTTTK